MARAQKHLLASSMGMSHGAVHRGGFPLTSPHSGVAWQTLPGSRTNGLFILPPWSCPLLPAPFGTDTCNTSAGQEDPAQAPESHSCNQLLCPWCAAIPVGSILYVDKPLWLTLLGIFLVGDGNSEDLNCFYQVPECRWKFLLSPSHRDPLQHPRPPPPPAPPPHQVP